MTKQQFLDNFYLAYDKVATLQAPGYDPTEVSLFATEAQELLVVTKYNPMSNPLKEGFEETEKRIQDLGNLIKDRKITPAATSSENMTNGVFVTLPNSILDNPSTYTDVYWFTIFEQAICNEIDPCTSQPYVVDIYEINHGEYAQLLMDPFNRPSKDRIWRMKYNTNRHELITDGTLTISKYHVRYIRKPIPIDLTTTLTAQVSELADHVHRELLRKTVELALKDTENTQRFQAEINTRKE